jgi:hypothetical protein
MAAGRATEQVAVGGVDFPRNWHEFLTFFASEQSAARQRRAMGDVGEARNLRQPGSQRPGGSGTRLDDDARRRRHAPIAGGRAK